jgi:hypothetical protein
MLAPSPSTQLESQFKPQWNPLSDSTRPDNALSRK